MKSRPITLACLAVALGTSFIAPAHALGLGPRTDDGVVPIRVAASQQKVLGIPLPATDGVVRVKSAYGVDETIARLKADIAAKGIRFFGEVDQTQLAQGAGIALHRSTLLEFGNPPLGTQFITARAEAGLDWPVRLLVTQDERGDVWAVYTDFVWIAKRHGISNRAEQFKTASGVVASITASITGAVTGPITNKR